MSLSLDLAYPILDGNVKRVLTRCFGIEGYPEATLINQSLWTLIEKLTPKKQAGAFNQAMMDVGATVCTRTKPHCVQCPLQKHCVALKENKIALLPTKKPKLTIKSQKIYFLLIKNEKNNQILLQKRDHLDIWAGLWCLPSFSNSLSLKNFVKEKWANQKLVKFTPPFIHLLTHRKLHLHNYLLSVSSNQRIKINDGPTKWYTLKEALNKGIPKPVRSILEILQDPALL